MPVSYCYLPLLYLAKLLHTRVLLLLTASTFGKRLHARVFLLLTAIILGKRLHALVLMNTKTDTHIHRANGYMPLFQ
jgi:hypothetical protein